MLRALCLSALLLISSAFASSADNGVDLELVIAVDVSYSVSGGEGDVQRIGYAAALESPEVIAAITGGLHGRVALTYVEWADDLFQHQIIPWQVVESRADARRMAEHLRNAPITRSGATSISSALLYAAELFDQNPWRGIRRVIDISGDGPNNQGPFVTPARDQVAARGITINGLPLFIGTEAKDTLDLVAYFEDCVVAGPGNFIVAVDDLDRFEEAIKRKLVLEIAGIDPGTVRFAASRPAADCKFGERQEREKLKQMLDSVVPENENRWIQDDDF